MTTPIKKPVLTFGRLSGYKGVLHKDPKNETRSIYHVEVDIDGTNHDVALKIMRGRATANECLANLIGRHLGFNVLDPYLVVCSPELFTEAGLKIKPNGIFFGTGLTGLKTMDTKPEAQNFEFWQTGQRSDWFKKTFVFDTLIGNEERVMKNLFFTDKDGEEKFVILDHQICLFGLTWKIELMPQFKNRVGNNVLSKWLNVCPVSTLDDIMQTAKEWQGCITPEVLRPLRILEQLNLLKREDLATIYDFLSWRANNLPDLVMKQINLERQYPTGTW